MKVVLFAQDSSGCYWHRLRYPADVLVSQGLDVVIAEAADEASHPRMAIRSRPGMIPRMEGFEVPEADVVVLQRPLRWEHWACIDFMHQKGVRVVVELDDDFHNISPSHAAWRAVQPKFSPYCNKEHLVEVIRRADALVVSTPALVDVYGPYSAEVHLVPNYIPRYYCEIPRPENPEPIVGWSGTVASHPNDLKALGNSIARLVREQKVLFSLVGDDYRVRSQLGISEMTAWGWAGIEQYPYAMATFDIGVVPLELSRFNNAKSALKVLTNAALGTPCFASPSEPNKAMVDDGVCNIAETPRDWYEGIKFLAENRNAACENGRLAREAVLDRYTMEANAWRFAEAWIGDT